MLISVTFQIMSDFKTLFFGRKRSILLKQKSLQSVISDTNVDHIYLKITA